MRLVSFVSVCSHVRPICPPASRFPVLSALALELLSTDPARRPTMRALRDHPLLAAQGGRLDRALGAPCATAQLADAHRVIRVQEGEIDSLKRQLQAAQEELSRLQVGDAQ